MDSAARRGAAFGAAMGTALGGAVLLLGEFGRAAAEEEAIMSRLEQAVENTGASFDDYATKIERAIERGERMAFSDDQVATALASLTTITGDAQVALDNIGLAMDVARARGIDLSTAATLVGKVHEGNLGILSRYGIQIDKNATATEALALLQQRTAGQAQAYSETQAASIDRATNKLDNFTESLGEHAGALATVVALLPGLTAGWGLAAGAAGGIAGALGGGAGLTGGLVALGGALTTVGLAVAALTPAIAILGYTVYTAKDNLKAVTAETEAIEAALKGSTYAADEFTKRLYSMFSQTQSLVEVNGPNGLTYTLETAFPLLLQLSGDVQDAFLDMAHTMEIDFANPTAEQIEDLIDQLLYFYNLQRLINDEQYTAMELSRAQGLNSSGMFVASENRRKAADDASRRAAAIQPSMTFAGQDSVTALQTANAYAMEAGALEQSFASAINGVNAWSMATNKATQAAREQYGAFYGLVEGINSAHDATTAFKAAQDGLLADQQIYSGQISEYTSQQNALTSAYEILLQRQADGAALTKEEQALLANYPKLYERVTGGVEDATVAQGLLAAEYIENMTKGDMLNDTLMGNTEATADLVRVIEDLILSLNGVPDEVRSRIYIDRAEESRAVLADIAAYLNGLDGRSVNFSVNASGNGLSLGNPSGVGIIPLEADGGTIFSGMRHYADGGTHAIVGERGPELVWLPNGAQVMNTEGTQSRMRGQRTNGGNVYVTVYANSWGEFQDSMRSRGLAEALY